ncbi:hypothetical protein [Streptomyces sp. NPDC085540]|uniref:hypothetical protein n=1 Tax=Streptomyces sp. NPDC085540 TaxID=3365730 RepID=UPI0037CF4788
MRCTDGRGDVGLAQHPLACREESLGDVTELGCGHRSGVVGRAESDRIQHLRPGRGGAHTSGTATNE